MRDNDPDFQRLLRQGLNEPAAQQGAVAAQVWGRCGGCPKCGAPIWFCAVEAARATPPMSYYTCPCTQLEREIAQQTVIQAHGAAPAVNGKEVLSE